MTKFETAVASLLKAGNEKKSATIVCANQSVSRITLTLDKPVLANVAIKAADGKTTVGYEIRESDTLSLRLGAFVPVMEEDDLLSQVKTYSMVFPQALCNILRKAEVDLIIEEVDPTNYVDPFTGREVEFADATDGTTRVVHHVVGIRLSKAGEKAFDKVYDRALEFSLAEHFGA